MQNPRHPWFTLLALTLLAGVLRFYQIDKPAIWGDEAATWRRVSGTYQQMIDELRLAGFMPANYLITWAIKEGIPLSLEYRTQQWWQKPDGTRYWGEATDGATPSTADRSEGPRWDRVGAIPTKPRQELVVTRRLIPGGLEPTPLVMRFVPALCGTLMVPAMYFLAVQLVQRRTALLVALFTCCSAYLLNYSRDAKMYMQLWFFATLHVACFLWWLRAYDPRFNGQERERLSEKQQDVADGIAGVLPADHVTHVARAFVFDAPLDNSVPPITRLSTLVRWMCWLVSGLAMIAFQGTGLAIVGIEVLIFLATMPGRLTWMRRLLPRRKTIVTEAPSRAQFVVDYGRPASRWSFVRRLSLPPILGFALGVTAIVMLFNSYRDFSRFYDRVEPGKADSTQIDVSEAGLEWVESYNDGRTAAGHFLENATAFLFSWEWVKPDEIRNVDPTTLWRLRTVSIVLLIAIGAGLLPWRRLLDRMTGSPRAYDRGPMPMTSMLIVCAWVLIPAYGIFVASGAWDDRGYRSAAPPPNATMAQVAFPNAQNGDVSLLRGALTRELKPVTAGTTTFAAARESLAKLPWGELFVVRVLDGVRWWVVGVAVVGLFIVIASWPSRALPDGGPPLIAQLTPSDDKVARMMDRKRRRRAAWFASLLANGARALFVVALLWLLLLLVFAVVPQQNQSVWMPRYIGFVWPAFAIGVCVLIMRLPLAPLRWLVVGLLLFANLANVYARREFGEPPTPVFTQDQIALKDDLTQRLFAPVLSRTGFGEPGSGVLGTMPNSYYLSLMGKIPATPRSAFTIVDQNVRIIRLSRDSSRQIAATLKRDKQITSFLVWACLPSTMAPDALDTALKSAMPKDWIRDGDVQRWQVYDHWTWQKKFVMERQRWQVAPATQPTTRP